MAKRASKAKAPEESGESAASQPDVPKVGKVALRFKTKDEQECVTGIACGQKQFTSKDGKFLVDADVAATFLAQGMERC